MLKIIEATSAKPGTIIMIDGEPCEVKSQDVSKTGKHGASKVRIEAVGVIDGKKRVIVKPGSERFEVPLIQKRRGQVLAITGDTANIMDVESYETLDLPISDEIKENIAEGKQVEYWDIEGRKIIKRVFG